MDDELPSTLIRLEIGQAEQELLSKQTLYIQIMWLSDSSEGFKSCKGVAKGVAVQVRTRYLGCDRTNQVRT